MPTVLNNIGISGDYGQIVFHNDGTDNIIDLSHSNARIVTHDLSINNTLQAGQILGTKSGKVIELSGNALLVPVGTDNQRPDNASGAVGVGEIGMIRYNTTSNTFEGYGPTAWGSLGGVINTQQNTFVEAVDEHSNHDISSNSIQFTTSGELVAVINSDGNVGIGTSNPLSKLDVYDGNVTIRPAAPVSGAAFNSDGALILTNGGYETNSTVPQIKFGFGNVYNNNYFSYMLSRHHTAASSDANSCALDFRINSGVPGSSAPTSGTELALSLTGAGRVGIGTTYPSEALDVSGNIIINGQIMGKGTGTGGNSDSYFGLRHATPVGFEHNQILLRTNGDIYLGSESGREISFFNGNPATRANEFMRLKNGDLILYDGDISLNGNILAIGDISLNGKLYATGDVSLNANINIGGNATIQNDLHVKNDATIDNDVFVNGSGTIENDLHIKRHLIVDGSLSFLGEFTQRDTVITVTEQMDLSNDGTGPALIVRQHGAQPVATFYDDTTMAMIIKDGGDVSFNKNVIIDGNVGIGITNPAQQLEVSGNIKVTGTQISIDRPSPGNYCYFTGQDSYTVFSGANNTQLHANNGAIELYTNSKKRLHIKSDGLIGIGTNGPTTRLDISNNTSNSVLAVRQHDLAENIAEFYNGTNQVMVIDNSGSLGINRSNVTTNFALDVSGAAIVSNTLRIRDDAVPEGAQITMEAHGNAHQWHMDVAGGHFRIFKGAATHSIIINKTTNFIGLNGVSPAVELDISGTGAIRIPVGNDGTDRQNFTPANGMIRYNNTDNRYEGYIQDETNPRWHSLSGGGGSGNLETNIRTLNQGDTLFNIDVSGNTAGFSAHKVSMSDDGNRVAIVDSTVHDSHTTDATVKIYDYNVNNNQYEVKETITFERNASIPTDEEGIRGIHMTGDKNTILVVTANVTGTDANANDYDGSYNFIPYELTSSDPVTYTRGISFTVDNAPWYDMDDGTTLMIAKKNATGSNRDVYFYNYSGSNKEFTLSQTIDYATDISNALPAGFAESTTAPKHVAISGNGLRALWVEEDRTNIIVFKRLSTFADFQILQTIQLNGVIGTAFTLPNLDYDGKFMAVSMSGISGASNEIRIYAYDETKFNYVLESSFNEIATLDDDDGLGRREAHISKDGTRLFVGCSVADNGLTQDTGAIAMLKLDKQGKVPVSSGTATAEYIAYGPTTDSYLGMGLSTDYNGKRMIGMGINGSTSNVRVIQTQEDSITMSSTYDINELKTSSGTLTLSPYNNIVDISANVGIGTTYPTEKLQVIGNIQLGGEYVAASESTIHGNTTYTNLTSQRHLRLKTYGHTVNDGFISFSAGSGSTEHMRIDRYGNVGIGTTYPYSKCQIGSIGFYRRDDSTHGTNDALTVIIPTPTSNTVLNDPHDALILVRKGTAELSWQAQAHLRLSRYENSGTDARTRLDFALGHDSLGTNAQSGAAPPDVMTLLSNGHLGIGTTNPTYPLDVKGSVVLAAGSRSVYLTSGLDSAYTSTNDVTIQSEKDVKATAYIATSDERIKKDILDINDDAALQKLRIIEPKTYKYKDVASRGTKTVFGFIAQQIDTVLPEAVSKLNDVIPNTYELGDATSSSNNEYYDTIHFTDFNTANLDVSSNNLVLVDANNKKQSVNILSVLDSSSVQIDTDLSEWMGAIDVSNETVIANEVQTYEKVILDANNIVVLENYDITSIASMDASDNVVGKMADLTGDNTIDSSNNYVDASGNFIAVVNSDGHYIDASGNYFDTNGNFMDASNNLVGTYKTEWKKVTINGTKIFVYGQHVDDFHALNKDYIFTVATAALQEVDRQLQAEKAKTATLESQVADLLARVTALESA